MAIYCQQLHGLIRLDNKGFRGILSLWTLDKILNDLKAPIEKAKRVLML